MNFLNNNTPKIWDVQYEMRPGFFYTWSKIVTSTDDHSGTQTCLFNLAVTINTSGSVFTRGPLFWIGELSQPYEATFEVTEDTQLRADDLAKLADLTSSPDSVTSTDRSDGYQSETGSFVESGLSVNDHTVSTR